MLTEELTKLTQTLNLAKQSAVEANKQAKPILSIALVQITAEVADLERRTAQLLEATIAEEHGRSIDISKAMGY